MPSTSTLPLVTAALSTVALTSTYFLLQPIFAKPKCPTIAGPKPPIPYLGNLDLIIGYVASGKDHELRDILFKQYGEIYKLETLDETIILLSNPSEARKVFMQGETYMRNPVFTHLAKGVMSYGLFIMPAHQVWKRHRKVLTWGFGPSHIRETVVVTNQVMDVLEGIWRDQLIEDGSKNLQVDLFNLASSITIDVIGRIAFSHDYKTVLNHREPAKQKELQALNDVFKFIIGRYGTPEWMWGTMGLSVNDVKKRTAGVREGILESIRLKRAKVAEKEKKAAAAGGEQVNKERDDDDDEQRVDMLDRVLNADGWSEDEIIDEVIAIFLAGGETSANTIVFVMLMLHQHPDVLARLQSELDTVLGPRSESESDVITNDHIPKLVYLDMVIKETMRLHPVLINPVYRVVMPKEGVELCGHHIPQNTRINIDIRSIHRHPDYWPEPLKFDPERFAPSAPTPKPGTYMPFGEGWHVCLGNKMAMVELKVVVARLVRGWKLRLGEGAENAKLVTLITHGYKEGIKFDVERR
ncbi:hypothetical protein HDV05_000464 [Chytridiales sp. JEL 0842]|nr:hypothetical protein HDV05_000464 [Chytridiales sp. JEL 0842]